MPRSNAPLDSIPRKRHPLAVALTLVMVASLIATAVSLALPSAQARAATTSLATASVTPDTALVYMDVNLDTTSDQWSRANELFARIGINNALDKTLDSSNMSANEKEVAQAVLGGEVAVVLEKFPATGNLSTSSITSDITNPAALTSGVTPQGYALILAPSDLDKSYSALEQSLTKEADANGTTVDKATYKGVEIESVAPSGTSAAATPTMTGMATAEAASSGQAVAKVKDFILIGSVPEDLHSIIDTANGDTPALADDAHFKDLRGELNQDFLAFGFVNGPATLASMQANDPATAAELGTQNEQTFQSFSAFVVWADDPGLRIDTMATSATATPLPQMKTIDDSMAQKVPADSLVFTTSTELGQNPGLQALALTLAQGMLGSGMMTGTPEATPAAALDPNQVFEQAAGVLGFNLKTDFLDQLTGNYAFALTVQNVFSGVPSINGILVSDTKDEPTITKTMSQIVSLLKSGVGDSATVSTKTVGGSKVTEFDLSSSGFPLKVQLGVVNGQFAIGIGDGLEQYLGGPQNPLADDANYKQVIGALPKDHTSVAYLNVQQLLPLIEGYMSTSSGSDMGGMMAATPAAEASPASMLDQYKPLKGIGVVGFNKGEMVGSSMIIYIASK